MKKESFITYLFIFILIGGALGLLYFLDTKMTGFAFYEQTSQVDFDEGTYENTEYNGSAIILSENNLIGTYTSKVFDAGNDAIWNNLNLQNLTPQIKFLYAVDGGGEVFKSINLGVNWTMTKEDYGRASDTIAMFADSSYIYIIASSNQELWRSSDSGLTWSVINDTFPNNAILLGEVNSDENIFIADGSGDVYMSSNNGVTWALKGDFNAGTTNNGKGMAITSGNIIYIVDGSGYVFSSSDSGVSWIEKNSGYGGGVGTDDLESDSENNLYILNNKQIYKSVDSGTTWVIINNSFTPYSGDGYRMLIDSQNNFFIGDGAGRNFKSADSGVSWTEQGDINGGAGSIIWGISEFNKHTNLTFYIKNCSQSDCSDAEFIEVDLNNINMQSRYFQYKISFSTPDSSITPLVESVSIDYDLINSPPIITLINPQEGVTYGYNESIALDFIASDTDNNIDSCWYNLDNGNNVLINNCLNTAFDVSEESHILNIFINDTLGEQAEDSVSFSVQVGAPTIILNYPIDEYLNYQEDIQFTYTPDDIDLDSCELWGDFTENFELNQTSTNPTSGLENVFSLTLNDGDYLWNIKCNDSLGNSAFNGNKTFYVDTLHPTISLIEPIGAKSSRTIPFSWNIIEEHPDICWYNIYRGENIEITNTSLNCSVNSITFDVTIDADFILNFYINDSAGNLASASSSFSVSTSSTEVIIPPSTGGSSSSGGGGGSISIVKNITPILSIDKISNLIVKPSDVKKISWNVKNIGTIFVNDCALKGLGEYSSWIFADETKNLAAGEEYEFNFNLNIPETMGAGEYSLSISLECKEISESSNFIVEIIEKKLDFDLIEVKRDNNENVNVIYSLEELSGIEQNVELQFLLFGVENEKIAEIKDIKKILANSKQEFEIIIPVDPSLKGELNLLVNLNSETYSTFVQENIILGSPISGFAIFGERTSTDNALSVIFLILFLIFAFIMIRKIIKLKRKKK